MASIQLPFRPIFHKSSCHKLTAFFLGAGIIVLFNKVPCKGYYQEKEGEVILKWKSLTFWMQVQQDLLEISKKQKKSYNKYCFYT